MNEARKLLRRIVIKWLIQAHLGPNGSQALTAPHSDLCTCTITDLGKYRGENMHPPEWEQDPWCPTHPRPVQPNSRP